MNKTDGLDGLKDAKGMLLLEVLFAFCILVFVVVSSGGLLFKTAQIAADNKGRLLALQTAQSAIEEIKDTALIDIATIEPSVPAGLNQGTVTIQTNPQNVQNVDLVTVTVTVSWRAASNRMQQLQISTMKSRF